MIIMNQAMSLICFPLRMPRCTPSAHMLRVSAAGTAQQGVSMLSSSCSWHMHSALQVHAKLTDRVGAGCRRSPIVHINKHWPAPSGFFQSVHDSYSMHTCRRVWPVEGISGLELTCSTG